MTYEVERKFRVIDLSSIEAALRDLGATEKSEVSQSDLYFSHPSRDFQLTDEAFRIRRVGHANYITYKGPKIDRTTKTRREIEVPLPDGEQVASRFAELLTALGFSPVAEVIKVRRLWEIVRDQRTVEVALDEVRDVGRFVELELSAREQTLEAAKKCLVGLAAELKLSDNERRSYLELLLNQR